MNDYLNALYSDVPSANPNEWSQMLMSMANQNNQWSAEQAQKQMDFQKEMSDTAVQRQVADLKAAGINPILSAKLGGASTPNGASATADSSIVSSMVSLMDKMLDVQGTSAATAYNYSGGSGSGGVSEDTSGLSSYINTENGITEKGEKALASALDLIPGVSSQSAKVAAAAIADASHTGFGQWLLTGKTSSGEKNTFQTPLTSSKNSKIGSNVSAGNTKIKVGVGYKS